MTASDRLPVVLWEAPGLERSLGPIAHTRPAFEIRCGALNLRERIAATGWDHGLSAVLRPELAALADTVGIVDPPARGDVLVVDSRVHGSVPAIDRLLAEASRAKDGTGPAGVVRLRAEDLAGLDPARVAGGDDADGIRIRTRPWEVVPDNDRSLIDDAAFLRAVGAPPRRIWGVTFEPGSKRPAQLEAAAWIPSHALAERFPDVVWIDPDHALVADGARIRPGAVIDAEDGPVIIGPGCVVHPLSVITGPSYLGPGTTVNPGSKIREGSSIGAFCKVGGEVEETVMLDLSNKQHDGFLGHALVGSWVNLGADTNGSDLKNNYGSVRVDLGDGPIDTGETFVGQHLADHVKTGIDTMLTTGGVVGVAGNVFGGGFAPRFVPAFGWGGPQGISTYRLDDALATARTAMARRDVVWTDAIEALLRHVFEATRSERGD